MHAHGTVLPQAPICLHENAFFVVLRKNEDRIIYEADLEAFDVHPDAGKLHSFFAVLDGHNGEERQRIRHDWKV